MSLLREIQDAAIDASIDIETLLRKCRVLASRLQNTEFKRWIQSELDGYPCDVMLPDYRIMHCQAYGNFTGSIGRHLDHAKIPQEFIPESLRPKLTHYQMSDSVSSLMEMIKNCENSLLQMRWSPENFASFATIIYQNMKLTEAWISIPQSAVIAIVHTIRNRILNFVLEVESKDPEADKSKEQGRKISDEEISEIFNEYLFGTVGSMAPDQGVTMKVRESIHSGDFDSVAAFLDSLGFSESEIDDLREAVATDNPPIGDKFEEETAAWIGAAVSRIARGETKLTLPVASKVLSDAIQIYYKS